MARNWIEEAGLAGLAGGVDEALKKLERLDQRVKKAFIESARRVLVDTGDAARIVRRVAEAMGLKTRRERLLVYRAFYLALLGEGRGPPLRRILAREDARNRLKEILAMLEEKEKNNE